MSPSSSHARLHTHATDATRRLLWKVRADARTLRAPRHAGAAR
ncbi:hypothetical protein ACFV9E_33685 [Streptomyces sp. NPDC059835]